MESAAGIGGLIKTVLALQQEEIPRHLHFHQPNSHIAWEEIPVVVAAENTPWPKGSRRRIAGVSSFGFSGTNAHVVLEEAPPQQEQEIAVERPYHLLTLSAKSEEVLKELAARYADHLGTHKELAIGDVCYTANVGRQHHGWRAAVVARTIDELKEKLAEMEGQEVKGEQPRVVFEFPDEEWDPGSVREMWSSWGIEPAAAGGSPNGDGNEVIVTISPQEATWERLLTRLGELYVQGLAVDWAGFDRDYPRRHVILPTYPFQRRRFWPSEIGTTKKSHVKRAGHPLLGQRLHSAVPRKEIEFETHDTVFRSAISPPAIFLEMALAAAFEVTHSSSLVLEDITIHRSIFLPKTETKDIRLVLTPQDAASYSFQILSRASEIEDDQPSWTLHASGNVQTEHRSPKSHRHDLAQLRAEMPERALVRLQIPEESMCDAPAYWLHPLLLDGCFQAVAAALGAAARENTYTPVAVRRLSFYSRPALTSWSYAQLQPGGTGDVILLDSTGEGIAELEGIQLKQIEPFKDWLYEVEWRLGPAAIEVESGIRLQGRWLILADEQGVGEQLAELLRLEGEVCTVAFAGDIERLVESTGGDDLRGVVHLWSLDTEDSGGLTAEKLMSASERNCGSALYLVQALARRTTSQSPRLCLVTRGVQPVGTNSQPLSVAQSLLSGLAKTIGREHPEMRCLTVDLDASRNEDDSRTLFRELWPRASDGEGRVAYRGGKRYVSRLINRQQQADLRHLALRPDATYLITGATGGIGLHVAEWMVNQGARHLVMVARSAAGDKAQKSFEKLRNAGAEVVEVQADVSDPDQVDGVLGHIRNSMPKLRGIMHCAGVFEDSLLIDHKWEFFEKVFAAKVMGAWNLHVLTQRQPLDFLVFFSSAASLFGAAGQANYVAANEFMDILAHHRQRQGMAGLSINWGPWAGTGMAEAVTETRRSQWTAMGLELLDPEKALTAMDYLLHQNSAQVAVLNANWPRLRQQFSTGAIPPFLSSIAAASSQPAIYEYNFRQQLAAAPALDRKSLLAAQVRAKVAKVLGLDPPESVDPKRGFFDLGLDSLASMELRNELQALLGCTLSSTLTFRYPTVEALVNHLAHDVFGLETAAVSQNGLVKHRELLDDAGPGSQEALDIRIAKELQALEGLLN
jgi:acyl transferase domain-containing protein/acyl carrier protein